MNSSMSSKLGETGGFSEKTYYIFEPIEEMPLLDELGSPPVIRYPIRTNSLHMEVKPIIKKKGDLSTANDLAKHDYKCDCVLCQKAELHKHDDFKYKDEADTSFEYDKRQTFLEKHKEDDDRDYSFILKRLCTTKSTTRPLKMIIPDTVIFGGGDARMIIHMTGKLEDRNIKFIKQRDRLNISEIRKFFPERRRKMMQEYREELNTGVMVSSYGQNLANSLTQSKKLDSGPQPGQALASGDDQNDNSNTGMAYICRYKQENHAQMMTETEFFNQFMKSKTHKMWREILYIQTMIKRKN